MIKNILRVYIYLSLAIAAYLLICGKGQAQWTAALCMILLALLVSKYV